MSCLKKELDNGKYFDEIIDMVDKFEKECPDIWESDETYEKYEEIQKEIIKKINKYFRIIGKFLIIWETICFSCYHHYHNLTILFEDYKYYECCNIINMYDNITNIEYEDINNKILNEKYKKINHIINDYWSKVDENEIYGDSCFNYFISVYNDIEYLFCDHTSW